MAVFAKTSSSYNSTLEKCQHSLKSCFKKAKTQIQKGANPEKAARRGYTEFALFAFLVVQVSISQGGRRLPPQKIHL